MTDKLIGFLSELKKNTLSSLTSYEMCNIPVLLDNLEFIHKNGYYYDDQYTDTDQIKDKETFLVKNLPVKVDAKTNIYSCSLDEAIYNKYVYPILIFINHKLHLSRDITIVEDYHYTYLVFEDIDEQIQDIECILLPSFTNIEYTNNNEEYNESTLYFDIDGNCTDDMEKAYIKIEFKDIFNNSILYGKTLELSTNDTFSISSNDKETSILQNILLFKDGKLWMDGIQYISEIKTNVFKYTGNESVILKSHKLINKKYFNPSMKNNHSNIIDMDKMTDNRIYEKFDFKYDSNKSLEQNVSDTLDYIANYDSTIFNEYIKTYSNIESITYLGKDIINRLNSYGELIMPRRRSILHDNLYDNYVIIFVNNELYKYYHLLEYDKDKFKVPMIIKNDDIVEFLYFYNANNEIGELVLSDSDTYIDDRFDLSNCELFSNDIEEPLFDVEGDSIQESIPFTYTTVDKNKCIYNISCENPYYSNKRVTICNKNQFRHCFKVIYEDRLDIELSKDFKYCRNKDRFFVFINGKKIEKEYFRLVYNEQNTPINKYSIYFNLILHENDVVNVFYLPNTYERYIYTNNIVSSNGIIVDTSSTLLNLSNDYYMIFVNGKRILTEQLLPITKDKMKINIDTTSKNNIVLYRLVDPINELSELLNKDDSWSNIYNDIPTANKLFYNTTHTDTDENMYNEIVDNKAVVYEVINDFYLRSGIYTGDPIFYTYDDSVIDESLTDSEGNYIIKAMNANSKDKANIYNTDYMEVETDDL